MTKTLSLGGIRFTTSVEIAPEKAPNGRVRAHMPQSRYQKADAKPLNPHGAGPFCRFMAAEQAELPQAPGVYVLTIDGAPTYVGKAHNLAQRWGPQGYGTISPANCFIGGQSTNCRINHEIFKAARADQFIQVWARQERDDPSHMETRLIRALQPPWNIQIP